MPTPRTEVATVAAGDQIVVAGGFVEDGDSSDVVEIYDTRSDAWRTAPKLPQALNHAALAWVNERLWLVGGYRQDGSASSRMWSAEVDGTWRTVPDPPSTRGALAVAVIGDRIHVVGGAAKIGGKDRLEPAHEVFDISEAVWKVMANLPEPRDHLAAAELGGKLYVIGGRKLSLTTNSNRVDVYDPAADRWSRGPDLPTARGGLAAARVEQEIVVAGGEQPPGTFEEVEAFDGTRWRTLDPLPTSRHGLGAAGIENRVYVVGGGPEPGLSVSGANESLTL